MVNSTTQRIEALRPMRSLLERLPGLPLRENGKINFSVLEPAMILGLCQDAETAMNAVNLGMGALGHLLAQSSTAIESGEIGSDSVEHLGFLMTEMCDMAEGCRSLAMQCRQVAAIFQYR